MRFSPPLRGGLKIFGAVFLFEMGLVALKLVLKGSQFDPRQDPFVLLVPLVLGLLIATGMGLVHVRRARRDVPGAVTFDRYGFSVNGPDGAGTRTPWRLVRAVVFQPGENAEWRFELKNGGYTGVAKRNYSTEDWKALSEQFDKRLRRRGIAIGAPRPDEDVLDEA